MHSLPLSLQVEHSGLSREHLSFRLQHWSQESLRLVFETGRGAGVVGDGCCVGVGKRCAGCESGLFRLWADTGLRRDFCGGIRDPFELFFAAITGDAVEVGASSSGDGDLVVCLRDCMSEAPGADLNGADFGLASEECRTSDDSKDPSRDFSAFVVVVVVVVVLGMVGVVSFARATLVSSGIGRPTGGEG